MVSVLQFSLKKKKKCMKLRLRFKTVSCFGSSSFFSDFHSFLKKNSSSMACLLPLTNLSVQSSIRNETSSMLGAKAELLART